MSEIILRMTDLNRGQRRFLRSTSPFTLVAGGYGSGKTTALALKSLLLHTQNPGKPGLVIAPSWRTLKSVTLRSLEKVLRKGTGDPRFKLKIHDPTGEGYISLDGGKTPIFVRSAHVPASMEGLDVAWVAGDEVRYWSQEAYNVAIGRVRVKSARNQRVFVSTPQMHWMADEFNTGKKNRELITVATRENIDNLDPLYLDNLRRSYSTRLQKAILEGIFTILEGAVYETFDNSPDSMHSVNYDYRKYIHKPTYLYIDPGFRKSSVLWVREMNPGKWIIFHELHSDNMSMETVVDQVNQINSENGIEVDEIWCDPAADNAEQAFAVSVAQVLQQVQLRSKFGEIYYIHGIFRSITYGVEKVRALLGDPENGVSPRLFIASHLFNSDYKRGIVRSLSAYKYPDLKDNRKVSDNPMKDGVYDHACDALRYGCVGLFLTNYSLAQSEVDANIRAAIPGGYKKAAA